jgi:Ti-type conjugative transfer relaxase TraA
LAIYHLSAKPISRSSGRSAVAAAAYRCAEKLTNERDGITHDFTRKQGVEHCEIVLPEGVSAEWARDRSALWNAAEFAENRKDARVAREFEIALPHELSPERRIEAARMFARELADRYGTAVDFAIHSPHIEGDVRNHHAHVMMTTRKVEEHGLGEKTILEHKNARLLSNGLPTTDMQIRDLRQSWESIANSALQREGLDIRIDHRSHQERGLELEPTEHVGVHATQMQRAGKGSERARLDEGAARRNADLIRERPEEVLSIITAEKSVFDRRDIARALHRYLNDDVREFQNAFASVMASGALVELQRERFDPETGEIELARYSTAEMINLERGMALSADQMAQGSEYRVDRQHVVHAMARQDAAIQRSSGDASAALSDEQRHAIEHITGAERIAAVVGFAGAGKSTMLAAAREAWEHQGYRVHGAALSGKAAEGLEESSGIQSRTLASWSRSWEKDRARIGKGDVFVIDEAGMVGSRQLASFIHEAEQRGAKIVLVGDHEQLQAIGAGAPFRAIAERIGHAELSDIRRQRQDWQRAASVAFATHKTAEGLAAYREHGAVRLTASGDEARAEIVRDYLADRDTRAEGTRVAMAHRRADVRALNAAIRAELQARGDLASVQSAEENGEAQTQRREQAPPQALTYQTNDGKRDFAEGDRIVFLENDRDLGVKNGMLGTVKAVDANTINVALDGASRTGGGVREVTIPVSSYQSFDHGYATTIHKTQGATVDRAFVLASATMDRHLTYVAMTRHRDAVTLYANEAEFIGEGSGQRTGQVRDRRGEVASVSGRLVEHGSAPFEHKLGNRESYFVTLEDARGVRHTTWGVDLERAMKEAEPAIGAVIGLKHEGSVPVVLPDGTETHRNAWSVQDAAELAYGQLEQRLSRSGVKETTLDYARDFAERRGIAEAFGIRSEIEVPTELLRERSSERSNVRPLGAEQETAQIGLSRSDNSHHRETVPLGRQQDRLSVEHSVDEERARLAAGPADRAARAESGLASDPVAAQRAERLSPEVERPKRRGMFDGLKLKAPSASSQPAKQTERSSPQPSETARDHVANLTERARPNSGLEQAVDRYAQVHVGIERQRQQNLPVLDAQKEAYRSAAEQLERARSGSHALIQAALQYDPKSAQAMSELTGRDRVGALVAGMDRESLAQDDPNIRAERFVERWNGLRSQQQQLSGWNQAQAKGEVENEMRAMSQDLQRDPELETVLRQRSRDIGITRIDRDQALARELERQVTRHRSKDLGLER